MAAHVKVQANEIAANSGKTEFGNIAAYKLAPLLSDMDNEDILCKANLDGIIIPEYIPTQFLMEAGRSLPYTVGTDLTNALIVTTYLCLPGNVRKISSQEYDLNMINPSTSDINTIDTITLYGHDDGSGVNLDDLWVVISKA